jgi:hypothetical protein
MNKSTINIFLLMTLLPLAVYSQPKSKITGKIINHKNSTPVFYVNVFLANTTIGTTTDKEGNFVIENVPPGIFNLIVQHIGYELEVKQVNLSSPKDVNVEIRLRDKIISGEAIEIIAEEPVKWRENYKLFKKMFIGESENAANCKIENPELLSFNHDERKNIFIADADGFIFIDNRALGYRIKLLLRSFTFTDSSGKYRYYSKFDYIEPADDNEAKTWDENRRNTYKGSSKHFFSTIARNQLGESDFFIYGGRVNISRDSTYMRSIVFNNKIWITFGKNKTGAIELNHDFALIDQLGNLISPLSISKSGDWYNERIADLLPWDYSPPNGENSK